MYIFHDTFSSSIVISLVRLFFQYPLFPINYNLYYIILTVNEQYRYIIYILKSGFTFKIVSITFKNIRIITRHFIRQTKNDFLKEKLLNSTAICGRRKFIIVLKCTRLTRVYQPRQYIFQNVINLMRIDAQVYLINSIFFFFLKIIFYRVLKHYNKSIHRAWFFREIW